MPSQNPGSEGCAGGLGCGLMALAFFYFTSGINQKNFSFVLAAVLVGFIFVHSQASKR